MALRRGRRIVLALTVGVLALAIGGIAVLQDDVRDLWDIRRLGSDDPAVREGARKALVDRRSIRGLPHVLEALPPDARARDALTHILAVYGPDPRTAPGLAVLFEHPDSAVKLTAVTALSRPEMRSRAAVLALARGVTCDDVRVRRIAIRSLAAFGSTSEAALPALAAAVGDPVETVREHAAAALLLLGDGPRYLLPALVSSLEARDPGAVHFACTRLLELGGVPADVVAAGLERLLEHDNPKARFRMLQFLEGNQELAVDRVVVLAPSLDAPDVAVRRFVAATLEAAGERAAPVLGALIARTDEPDIDVRASIYRAVGNLGPGGAAAVPVLAAALRSPDESTHAAADALSRIGEAAIDALVEIVREEDHPGRGLAVRALGKIGRPARRAVAELARCVDLADPSPREEACLALTALGPDAREALPALLARLEEAREIDEAAPAEARVAVWSARSAARALAAIGEPAVEPLAAILARGDAPDPVIEAALAAVTRLGPRAAGLVDVLLPLLESERGAVNRAAALAVANLGDAAAPAVPRLLRRIREESARWSVGWAFEALAAMGRTAGAAAPALAEEVTRMRDDAVLARVTVEAARALWRVGGDAGLAAGILAHIVETVEPNRMGRAIEVLGEMGPAAAPAAGALARALRSGGPPLAVADAFRSIGEAGAAAVPVLVECLHSESEQARRTAALSLGAIGPAAAPAASRLIELLDDRAVAPAAASALGALGPAACDEVSTLIESFERSGYAGLARAVAGCGDGAGVVVPVLRRLLNERLVEGVYRGRRRPRRADLALAATAEALWRIEGPSDRLLAAIVEELINAEGGAIITSHEHGGVRYRYPERCEIADVIARLGPEGRRAAPALRSVIEREWDPELRLRAALALHAVEPGAGDAIEVLGELVEQWDAYLGGAAAVALGELGRDAAAAAPALARVVVTPETEPAEYMRYRRLGRGAGERIHHPRAAAAAALGRLGVASPEAVGALRAALADPESEVREAARAALRRLEVGG